MSPQRGHISNRFAVAGAALSLTVVRALSLLGPDVLHWARSHSHPPSALLADFFLGWTNRLAADLAIPHLVFYSSGAFAVSIINYLWPGMPRRSSPSTTSLASGADSGLASRGRATWLEVDGLCSLKLSLRKADCPLERRSFFLASPFSSSSLALKEALSLEEALSSSLALSRTPLFSLLSLLLLLLLPRLLLLHSSPILFFFQPYSKPNSQPHAKPQAQPSPGLHPSLLRPEECLHRRITQAQAQLHLRPPETTTTDRRG